MRYRVKALEAGKTVTEVLVDAIDEAGARQQVHARGLTVLSISRAGGGFSVGQTRFPLQLFSQELLALLESGLPLVESIEALAEKEVRGSIRNTMDALLTALREGRPFSAALQTQPAVFPELFVAMVKAAERTSDLDQALGRYIAYRQQVDTLRNKLISASVYPVMLLAIGSLVVLFLLGYVVPRFAGVFADMGSKLPFMSRLLLQWGGMIEQHAAVFFGSLLGFVVAAVMVLREQRVWAALGQFVWQIPGLGERLKVFQLARFYRTLGMLLRGGMPALNALRMSRELLSPVLRGSLDRAIGYVGEGRSLADTLTEHGLTTSVASRMLRVGERTGNLGEMAERIAAFHEEEFARWLDWLTRLIGPLLMLVIGSVIGLIVVLMYLPIFQLAESLQ